MITAYLDEPLLRSDPPACFLRVYQCVLYHERLSTILSCVCIHLFRSFGERARAEIENNTAIIIIFISTIYYVHSIIIVFVTTRRAQHLHQTHHLPWVAIILSSPPLVDAGSLVPSTRPLH
jgi:hypothetical protein